MALRAKLTPLQGDEVDRAFAGGNLSVAREEELILGAFVVSAMREFAIQT
jgi:hypothetical protein